MYKTYKKALKNLTKILFFQLKDSLTIPNLLRNLWFNIISKTSGIYTKQKQRSV